MANATIAQAVNRQTVALALQEARKQAGEHQAWLNAINKAARPEFAPPSGPNTTGKEN